jgi:hypothetical protein
MVSLMNSGFPTRLGFHILKNSLGRSDQAGRPGPFLGRFGPVLFPVAHLDILHFTPSICVILSLLY